MHRLRIRAGFVVILAATSWAQVTQRVNVSATGSEATGGPSLHPSISADGRWVAFDSKANTLVAGDPPVTRDIFVRDRASGTIELVSRDSNGVQANDASGLPSLSRDGRYVVFESQATNLVPGDTNFATDVFLRDLQSDTTELVSLDSAGVQGNSSSDSASTSADGRYVVFHSTSTNLVPGDSNFDYDVFLRDRQSGTTERVSVDSAGLEANDHSLRPSISADGRYVAFWSYASNLVPGDTNQATDVFVRDRLNGTTERVSVDSAGAEANDKCYDPSISADGRFVAFEGLADNLVPGDTNNAVDVFVRDRQLGTTERVSVSSTGVQGNSTSNDPSVSEDGRFVAFHSFADVFVLGAGGEQIYLRDRQSLTTELVSSDSSGQPGSSASRDAVINDNGRYVVFDSAADDLVPQDTNHGLDIFVRDRRGGTNFTSLCDPGAGGVIACPCGNPSGGSGQGCDNSSATGGALLTASGGTYLSSDSLVFTTLGEKPTALSILTQWTGTSATGAVYGMGVRCTSGTFKRLYTKSAVGGSITAPEYGAGDPTVSVRSASLGDTILSGQSRWYFVYYRDPIVLGGCPPSSTFNATQTGRVTWSP